jgi:transcriptional regulator with XRE-family HTH domain
MPFTIRQFDHHERLCDKLKALRKEAGLTLSQMETKTKINKTSIRHLESGAYDQLPDAIYTRNFLKVYLRVLRADEKYFLDLFEQERGTCDFVKQARLPRQRARPFRFLVASRFVKVGVFLLLAMCVVFYLGLQVQAILHPPELSILEPKDGSVTSDATILVTGTAEQDAGVQVNGTDVLLTKTGSFEVEVALERGLNIIKIESVKRYSRPSVEYRRVVLQQDESITLAPR